MIFRKYLLLLLVFSICSVAKAEGNQNDGNYWLSLDNKLARTRYVIGFTDGMKLGKIFTYGGSLPDTAEELNDFNNDSFGKLYAKYFTNVTAGQLVDGLDVFYEDFRNRNTTIYVAVWWVVQQISGKLKEEVEKEIEH